MSRKIAERVCFAKGHKMVSLVSGEILDPTTKIVIKKYSVLCEQCGLSENSIQHYRAIPTAMIETQRQRKAEKNGTTSAQPS